MPCFFIANNDGNNNEFTASAFVAIDARSLHEHNFRGLRGSLLREHQARRLHAATAAFAFSATAASGFRRAFVAIDARSLHEHHFRGLWGSLLREHQARRQVDLNSKVGPLSVEASAGPLGNTNFRSIKN